MSRKALHQLLQQYLDGTCTSVEKKIIEHWYELLDQNASLEDMKDEELENVEQMLWEKISKTSKIKQLKNPSGKIIWIRSIAAACVAGILILSTYYFHFDNKLSPEAALVINGNTGYIIKENKTNKALKIKLEDSSEVLLQPASILTYPKAFAASERKVFLSGEAFFTISKNVKRPFYLYNKNTMIKVVGTSFNVISKDDSELTEVAVRTGKVIVYENITNADKANIIPNGVILTPNQKGVYNSERKKFEKKLVDIPLPIPQEKNTKPAILLGKFILSETPLKDIFPLLEQMYGIEIIIENRELYQCQFTGDISSENLYDKLDLICQSVKSNYLIDGTKIYISGVGCKKPTLN